MEEIFLDEVKLIDYLDKKDGSEYYLIQEYQRQEQTMEEIFLDEVKLIDYLDKKDGSEYSTATFLNRFAGSFI